MRSLESWALGILEAEVLEIQRYGCLVGLGRQAIQGEILFRYIVYMPSPDIKLRQRDDVGTQWRGQKGTNWGYEIWDYKNGPI